ncbi:MAG: ABC transporter ATP-binding protein [Thermoprotei archaeon]|nr:MAG: ABC transporter ATP-binding protein [Thermoprotei archaeon]
MVVVEDLVKKFKDVVAVNGISFRIKKGEIFALLGPNGAGKTTTIHIIATLLKPTKGKVLVADYDAVREADKVRKKIGIVFQDPSLDNQLTGYDNMYIHGKLYGLRGRELHEKIMRLLDLVELKDFAHKKVMYYSGGMRRRLEIARSLLHEPEILILDEPTIGLDPHTRARIWDYIKYLRKEFDMTILMTTHYMDEAEELADRIAIMDKGKILAMGTADQLKSMLGQDVIYVAIDNVNNDINVCNIFSFAKICKVLRDNRLELVVDNATKALPEVFHIAESKGLKITEVSYRRPTLNEVFLHLTGRELRDSSELHPIPKRRMVRFR